MARTVLIEAISNPPEADLRWLLVLFLLMVPGLAQADEITIITPGVVARLCPQPNCGPNEHIVRIPEATTLRVEGMTETTIGTLPPVKWFEVTYQGKKGWVSIFDTDRAK